MAVEYISSWKGQGESTTATVIGPFTGAVKGDKIYIAFAIKGVVTYPRAKPTLPGWKWLSNNYNYSGSGSVNFRYELFRRRMATGDSTKTWTITWTPAGPYNWIAFSARGVTDDDTQSLVGYGGGMTASTTTESYRMISTGPGWYSSDGHSIATFGGSLEKPHDVLPRRYLNTNKSIVTTPDPGVFDEQVTILWRARNFIGKQALDARHVLMSQWTPPTFGTPQYVTIPGVPNGNTTTTDRLGIRVRCETDGQVTGIRYYRLASSSASLDLHLWKQGELNQRGHDEIRVQYSETRTSQVGWFEAKLPYPLTVKAGTVIVCSIQRSTGSALPYNNTATGAPTNPANMTFLEYVNGTSTWDTAPPLTPVTAQTHFIVPVFEPYVSGDKTKASWALTAEESNNNDYIGGFFDYSIDGFEHYYSETMAQFRPGDDGGQAAFSAKWSWDWGMRSSNLGTLGTWTGWEYNDTLDSYYGQAGPIVRPRQASGIPLSIGGRSDGSMRWGDAVWWVQCQEGYQPDLDPTAFIPNLVFPGTSGNYLSTSHDTQYNFGIDMTLVTKLALDDWTPSTDMTIMSKWGSAGQAGYRFSVAAGGYLRIEVSTTGAVTPPATATLLDQMVNFTAAPWTNTSCSITTGRNGNGAQASGATANAVYNIAGGSQSSTLTVGFAWRKTDALTTQRDIMRFNSDAGVTNHNRLSYNPLTTTLLFTNGTTSIAQNTATTFTQNTWYYIEVKTVLHDTTGSVVVRVNGTEVINATGLDTKNAGTSAVYDQIQIGAFVASTIGQYDDLYLDMGTSVSFKGDIVLPAAAGGVISFTSTVPVDAADGEMMIFYIDLDGNDGAGNKVAKFYRRHASDAQVWDASTLLGTVVTSPGVLTTVFGSTSPVEFGSSMGGTQNMLKGRLVYARAYVGGSGRLYLEERMAQAGSFQLASGYGSDDTVTVFGSVVTTHSPQVLWRFDVEEYPGGGVTTWTDPRGRAWTITDATAIETEWSRDSLATSDYHRWQYGSWFRESNRGTGTWQGDHMLATLGNSPTLAILATPPPDITDVWYGEWAWKPTPTPQPWTDETFYATVEMVPGTYPDPDFPSHWGNSCAKCAHSFAGNVFVEVEMSGMASPNATTGRGTDSYIELYLKLGTSDLSSYIMSIEWSPYETGVGSGGMMWFWCDARLPNGNWQPGDYFIDDSVELTSFFDPATFRFEADTDGDLRFYYNGTLLGSGNDPRVETSRPTGEYIGIYGEYSSGLPSVGGYQAPPLCFDRFWCGVQAPSLLMARAEQQEEDWVFTGPMDPIDKEERYQFLQDRRRARSGEVIEVA